MAIHTTISSPKHSFRIYYTHTIYQKKKRSVRLCAYSTQQTYIQFCHHSVLSPSLFLCLFRQFPHAQNKVIAYADIHVYILGVYINYTPWAIVKTANKHSIPNAASFGLVRSFARSREHNGTRAEPKQRRKNTIKTIAVC